MPHFVIVTFDNGKHEARRNDRGQLSFDARVAGLVASRIGSRIITGGKKRTDQKRVAKVQVMEFKDKAECESYLAEANSRKDAT